ncbi:helix-turn-helix transcriptional regulator [Pseudomonas aeruginosa]
MSIEFAKPVARTTAYPVIDLTVPGRLRVSEVLAVLKVSKSWFWKGVGTGMYPKPDYYVGKIPFWTHATILPLVVHGEGRAIDCAAGQS